MRKGVTCIHQQRQYTSPHSLDAYQIHKHTRTQIHTPSQNSGMCMGLCARACEHMCVLHSLSHRQQDLRAYVNTHTNTHTHTHTHTKRDLESLSEVVVCVQMGKRGPLRDDRVKTPKLLTEKKWEKGKKMEKWGGLVTMASDLLFTTRSQVWFRGNLD